MSDVIKSGHLKKVYINCRLQNIYTEKAANGYNPVNTSIQKHIPKDRSFPQPLVYLDNTPGKIFLDLKLILNIQTYRTNTTSSNIFLK